MTGQESLWSAQEVRTQADQCPGQVTVWDALEEAPACAFIHGRVPTCACGWTTGLQHATAVSARRLWRTQHMGTR